MKLKKAIVSNAGLYIFLLSLLTAISLINSNIVIGKILLVFVLLLVLLHPAFLVLVSRYRNILIFNVLFILFLLGVFAVTFRKLRDIMPDPAISKETSIGYAQYFGYPLYLDSIIFFILILSPVLFYTFVRLARKNKKKSPSNILNE